MKRDVGQRERSTAVFVYGTLLRGEPNHHRLDDSELVLEGHTQPAFRLHCLGAFPGMVAGGRSQVWGEVYLVGPDTLAQLDALEGHPRWYRRTTIVLAEGVKADTYLLPTPLVEGLPVITSGDWRRWRKEHCR